MKILQLFNPYVNYGGEENAVAQITAELEKEHELTNVFFDITKWSRRKSVFARGYQFLMMACNPFSILRVRREIAALRPDVILLHNIMPVGSAGLYLYLSLCGVPVVHYIHNFRPFSVNGYCWGDGRLMPEGLDGNFLPEVMAGSWQESRLKTAWYAILIQLLHGLGVYCRMAGWIAISEFMKDAFMDGGIDGKKIGVIPHSWAPRGEDTPSAEPIADAEEPVFLFLGRLSEEKGIPVLLEAWRMHLQAGGGGRLMIAGGGPLEQEIREACEVLRGAEFLGFKSGNAKTELLRKCTALVVPSVWWEPLGLVLYEAYEHSKPVLAARSGGIVEHVEHGITGWLHTPGDAMQLAEQIGQAAADPALCRALGENGRELVGKRSPSHWMRDFNEFIHEVVSPDDAHRSPVAPPLRISVYLADQNPGFDRSFGISRMSRMILDHLSVRPDIHVTAVVSKTSQKPSPGSLATICLPWGTRRKWMRLATDHLHPVFTSALREPDVYYFPKGYLPLINTFCHPSVVTIHDTIIQYHSDHYPLGRKRWEYRYWENVLKHTLKNADRILTVSQNAKGQITDFMERHRLPAKEIIVTFEPCTYEALPQPETPSKENYVMHLASVEPHKKTEHLIRWWRDLSERGVKLPTLRLVGSLPWGSHSLIEGAGNIEIAPFLKDSELRAAYESARAVIIPSEIEGFGLPALEAYYSGTPVCFVSGTSVEEVLSVTTSRGGFSLADIESLPKALDEVLSMPPAEIRDHGLKLRQTYSAERVTARIEAELRIASSGSIT